MPFRRRTPSRKWKQSINTVIASRRFAQAADRARAAREPAPSASVDSTDDESVNGGFHTAEEDSDLDTPPDEVKTEADAAEKRRMSEVRRRELEAKQHERTRKVEKQQQPPNGLGAVQQGVSKIKVKE